MVIRSRFAVVLLCACGTTAGEGAGDRNLPSAGLGPWRSLESGEVRSPPFISPTRSASGGAHLVALEDGTFALYRGDLDGTLVREASPEGLVFADPIRVLSPDAGWEGEFVKDPCVVRDGGRWRIYYEASGGIGLAEGDDGVRFSRVGDGPVLEAEAAWEGGHIGAPSVVPDGTGGFFLYYEAAGGIGLASSSDGATWEREAGGAVLAPGPSGAWDDRVVSDPAVRVHRSPTGRRTLQLFYLGIAAAPVDEDPVHAIGAAATFDGRVISRLDENPVLEIAGRRVVAGLGPPVDLGPARLLLLTVERGSGLGVGGAVWPPDVRFAPAAEDE
jgi:hypothetical protein